MAKLCGRIGKQEGIFYHQNFPENYRGLRGRKGTEKQELFPASQCLIFSWGPNSGPLQGQQGLLTAETSLQPCKQPLGIMWAGGAPQ